MHINNKKCSCCGIIKPLSEYHKRSEAKDGRKSACKKCRAKRSRDRRYRDIDECRRKEKISRDKRKDKIKEYRRRYRAKYREKINEYSRNLRRKNREHYREYHKKWSKNEKRRLYINEYMKNKRRTDVNFNILELLRARLRRVLFLRGIEKDGSAKDLLGCDIRFFKNYLESKFIDGMSWNNRGKIWEIDHIIPCSKFDLREIEQQKTCFHYTNLQPMFVGDNRRKCGKETKETQFTFI